MTKKNVYTQSRGGIERVYIGIFGRGNIGKSSLINLLTGQEIAIVSDEAGTTTDPVTKTVEIFGIGPATLIDTAGIDDLSTLGSKRFKKSIETIKKVDCAILLIAGNQFGNYEIDLIHQFEKSNVPYLIVHNKSDVSKIATYTKIFIRQYTDAKIIDFSTLHPTNKEELIKAIKEIIPENVYQQTSLIGDLVKPKDIVLLITPIDSEAPQGRIILPQNMTIRDALDNHCIAIVVKETELEDFLKLNIKPTLAITDSRVFDYVANLLPEEIPLTSFSIVFARMKGDFNKYIEGASQIPLLKENDNVLILESCTHQISCDDIGRVRIPKLLQQFTGKKLNFTFVSGLSEMPEATKNFALVIQCGGCMVTRKQLLNRIQSFISKGIPVTNYGMTLAYVNGIFERAIKPFKKNKAEFPSKEQ